MPGLSGLYDKLHHYEDCHCALPVSRPDDDWARDPTPLLVGIVMIAGNFPAILLTTDNARASLTPNSWHVGMLTLAVIILGTRMDVFCCAMLVVGTYALYFRTPALQTSSFVSLILSSKAMIYAIRAHASVEHPPEPVAGRVIAVGRGDRLYPGARRNCPGVVVGRARGGRAGRAGRVRRRTVFGEAAGFRAAWVWSRGL